MALGCEAALRRYLWDRLSDILPDALGQHASVSSGVSKSWTSGAGFEGFDNFRIELKKFARGQSNPTFLLLVFLSPPRAAFSPGTQSMPKTAGTQEPHRFVLRKKPASVTVSSAHAIEREFWVLQALRATDVPVPRALLLCEDATVMGTPFYIMEFVHGRVFSDPSLLGMTKHYREAAYSSAAETLAKIHRLDCRTVGLESFGRGSGGYFARQMRTLVKVAHKQVGKMRGSRMAHVMRSFIMVDYYLVSFV